jgi:hypothetical protein
VRLGYTASKEGALVVSAVKWPPTSLHPSRAMASAPFASTGRGACLSGGCVRALVLHKQPVRMVSLDLAEAAVNNGRTSRSFSRAQVGCRRRHPMHGREWRGQIFHSPRMQYGCARPTD